MRSYCLQTWTSVSWNIESKSEGTIDIHRRLQIPLSTVRGHWNSVTCLTNFESWNIGLSGSAYLISAGWNSWPDFGFWLDHSRFRVPSFVTERNEESSFVFLAATVILTVYGRSVLLLILLLASASTTFLGVLLPAFRTSWGRWWRRRTVSVNIA